MTDTPASFRKSTGTIAEILRQNGYATAWIGKNHNTPDLGNQPDRPVRPLGQRARLRLLLRLQGRRHGPVGADAVREPQPRAAVERSQLHLTTDLVDKAIAWLQKGKASTRTSRSSSMSPRRDPLTAPGAEGVDRQVQGPVRHGLGPLPREDVRAQKQLGVIPANAKLTPRPAGLPAWDSLSADQKRLYARMMEVFAGVQRASRSRDGAPARGGGRSFPTPTTR